MKSCHLQQHGWTYRCNAEWNKLVWERELYDFIHMCKVRNKPNEKRKKKTNKNPRLLSIEDKLVVAGGNVCGGMGEVDKVDNSR